MSSFLYKYIKTTGFVNSYVKMEYYLSREYVSVSAGIYQQDLLPIDAHEIEDGTFYRRQWPT